MRRLQNILILLFLGLCSATAQAHRPSDAFVTLTVEQDRFSGQWEIALRDLEAAVGVDANYDGAISWGELRTAQPQLSAALMQSLKLSSDGAPCELAVSDLLINDRLEGRYAWFTLAGQCPRVITALQVEYRLLFDLDPSHRGILVLHGAGQSHTAVMSPSRPLITLTLAEVSLWRQFTDYLREGVWHIWIGIDHILFLLALLLPAVVTRQQGLWQPVPNLRSAVWPVLGVVTAFTVAHSITLTLAALDLVRINSRWVESTIAASVVLAALNNIRPFVTRRRWLVAFVFGLIHGFGFASVLAELGLPQQAKLLSLVAFNLGVECGQLGIVALAIPVAYALRSTRLYRSFVLPWGSLAVAAIAAVWFYERAFGP